MFFRNLAFRYNPEVSEESQKSLQMIDGDLVKPARQIKGKYGKKAVRTRSKNVTRKKTDQQEKLMAFTQVAQYEALLELEPV